MSQGKIHIKAPPNTGINTLCGLPNVRWSSIVVSTTGSKRKATCLRCLLVASISHDKKRKDRRDGRAVRTSAG